MRDQMMGIDYFSLATDMRDDDKVFDLMYRYGNGADGYDHGAAYAAFGRLIDLLSTIYRDGFCLIVSNQTKLRLSQQMGMSVDDFTAFLETCVEVGLFDAGLWESDGVLTSRGIQKRYFTATKRRIGSIPKALEAYILRDDDDEAPQDDDENATPCGHDADMMPTPCAHDENTVQANKGKGKGKGKEEEEKEEISSSSKNSNREKTKQHPYPLSCMGLTREGVTFDDINGDHHDSPWDALTRSHLIATNGQSIESFAAAMSAHCPASCDEDIGQVRQCFGMMMKALERFDPVKGISPVPLALTIIKDRVVA